MQELPATSKHQPPSHPSPSVFGHVFRPLPSQIVNNFVNIPRLHHLLLDYPNQSLVQFVLLGFHHGFNLGFRGLMNEQPLKNNKSARENPEGVSKAITKEIQRGHTAGPFPQPPFSHCHVSPIGAAPKPDGSCRLILDPSQPAGDSINEAICKDEFPCKYTHFDAATDLVFRMGKGCYLTKIDIKHAYIDSSQYAWKTGLYLYTAGRGYTTLTLSYHLGADRPPVFSPPSPIWYAGS